MPCRRASLRRWLRLFIQSINLQAQQPAASLVSIKLVSNTKKWMENALSTAELLRVQWA
jgi:hypothetical protein